MAISPYLVLITDYVTGTKIRIKESEPNGTYLSLKCMPNVGRDKSRPYDQIAEHV
jgi:hypothetical protein